MDAISYTAARQNLAKTMDKVIDSREPVIITRQKAEPVVMISMRDYNSMLETMYLLGHPANAERLRESIAGVDAGKAKEVPLGDLSKL